MITVGRQLRYIARRGKLARRSGQIVTVLAVQKWQIVVRFPDGSHSHVEPRFLKDISHANQSTLPSLRPAPTPHS